MLNLNSTYSRVPLSVPRSSFFVPAPSALPHCPVDSVSFLQFRVSDWLPSFADRCRSSLYRAACPFRPLSAALARWLSRGRFVVPFPGGPSGVLGWFVSRAGARLPLVRWFCGRFPVRWRGGCPFRLLPVRFRPVRASA